MPSENPVVGIGWRHPHYRELLTQQPPIDFLEVHSENFFGEGGAALAVLMQGRAHYPVSLHGVGLSLGSALGVDAWHLDKLAQLVGRIEPVRVSDHACFARARMQPAADPHPQAMDQDQSAAVHASDLLPIPFSSEALDVLCANIQTVQERLKRVILVENLSAYIRWKPLSQQTEWPETAFLIELTRRTGCQLLVDVNNLYVNAQNANLRAHTPAALASSVAVEDPLESCRRWLDEIPPAVVGELHVAGHVHVNDAHGQIVIDDHGSQVCDAVWQLHARALQRFGAVPTLVEWDTDLPSLQTLLAQADIARRNGRVDAKAKRVVP